MRFLRPLLLGFALPLLLVACGGPPPGVERDAMSEAEVARLTSEILALGPGIDPEEAARAARIAYGHTATLAKEYGITDPPLIHNMKVNAGLRPRGLCWHWAEDIEKRLKAEGFRTLSIHRAIANADNPFRIDHSTAIVGRRGDAWDDGVVLDPWRWGGILFWSRVAEDEDYNWRPRREVLDERRARNERDAWRGVAVTR